MCDLIARVAVTAAFIVTLVFVAWRVYNLCRDQKPEVYYVAGPYRGDVERNIANARTVAAAIWKRGHAAICPHTNTHDLFPKLNEDLGFWIPGDFAMLERCDGIVMVPGWEQSEGARKELEHAKRKGLQVYFYPDLPIEIHQDCDVPGW